MNKYINVDKLLNFLKNENVGIIPTMCVIKKINELSEEREDGFTLGDIEKAIRFGELSTKESSIKLFEKKGLLPMEVTKQFIQSLKQPNPLEVAIKGDGTEEYGKKIIEYFEKLGGINQIEHEGNNADAYYYIGSYMIINCDYTIPKMYTEISLKEDEKKPSFKGMIPDLQERVDKLEKNVLLIVGEIAKSYNDRVEELETDKAALCKELTDLKLKLKDLSK